jgi:hypothetical protein
LDVPLTTLYYLLKGRVHKKEAAAGATIFQRQTIKLKPTLTDVKKIHRFMFAADKVKAVQNGVRGHQALWPAGEWNDPNYKIIIQQDGAGAHPKSWSDPVIIKSTLRELEDNGTFQPGKISFKSQPPNSPNTNICDLGLFNAVQSAALLHDLSEE